ncbi:SymE family type I addiction module toxin [Salmonella enterica]|nr:SymE family type I addiction module toxin [Salmonella enterica]
MQRHLKVVHVRSRHGNNKTRITTYYLRIPSQHLKADWLKEAGFNTGASMIVKISKGCLFLIAESNETRELRKELYQIKQYVNSINKGIKSVVSGD